MISIRFLALSGAFLLFISFDALAAERVYTLQDAYSQSLLTNERIKISEEDVAQSVNRIEQARSYLLPRVTASGGYTRYDKTLPPNGGPFLFQPYEQSQAVVEVSQPLYTGGRTLAAYRTAKTLSETSRKQLSTAQQDMLLNTAAAYYGVLKAEHLVKVSQDSLARMEEYKKVTERVASTRRTKATISDLLRARTLVSQAGIVVTTAVDGLKISRQRLNLITRLPVDALLAEPQTLGPPAESLDRLKEIALESRDDYASARLNVKAAQENITIVRGGHYPQLSAVGGMQYTDSYPATAIDATVYYAGLRLRIPLFEGGLMSAEISEARSKFRQSELALEELRRNIETEVYEAYVNMQTQTTVLETTKTQNNDAKENFDAVTRLFREGLVTSLAVIDAQQALFVAERELVNAMYDQQFAILRLKRSLGLLEKNPEPKYGLNHASS